MSAEIRLPRTVCHAHTTLSRTRTAAPYRAATKTAIRGVRPSRRAADGGRSAARDASRARLAPAARTAARVPPSPAGARPAGGAPPTSDEPRTGSGIAKDRAGSHATPPPATPADSPRPAAATAPPPRAAPPRHPAAPREPANRQAGPVHATQLTSHAWGAPPPHRTSTGHRPTALGGVGNDKLQRGRVALQGCSKCRRRLLTGRRLRRVSVNPGWLTAYCSSLKKMKRRTPLKKISKRRRPGISGGYNLPRPVSPSPVTAVTVPVTVPVTVTRAPVTVTVTPRTVTSAVGPSPVAVAVAGSRRPRPSPVPLEPSPSPFAVAVTRQTGHRHAVTPDALASTP
ncbi:Protein of unknown function [Gryllus bimaculatus]|nr:Protein of unknown function [Gryllus bimaculatus]